MEKIADLASANWIFLSILLLPYLSFMLYDFMRKGMIFQWYGNLVNKEIYFNDEIDLQIETLKISECFNDEIKALELQKIYEPRWKKPLGSCLKCFHVWVVIIYFIITSIITNYFNIDLTFDNLFFITIKFVIALSLSYGILYKEFY